MKPFRLSRRAILRGAGAALPLPLLEIMASGNARAEATALSRPPVRTAFFYIPNGVVQSAWNPVDTGEQFTLSPTMLPLAEVRSKLLVLGNLGRVKVAGTDGHAQASTCWLSTAAPDELSADGYPLKRSLDQVIADHAGIQTPFRSLELSCNPFEDNRESVYFDNISWYGGSHVASSLRDPQRVFERLFRFDEQASRRSVLDLVAGDARSLRPRLGQRDREKLEEYSHSVRTVEQQIQRVRARQDDIRRLNPQVPVKPWQAMHRDEFIQVMGDLMILALQADLTRVATLMTAPERWATPLKVEGWFEKPIEHHSWTHNQRDDGIRQNLAKLDRFHIEQFARLVQKMDAVKEGEGTLLDNTMFLLGSGLGSGELHEPTNLPTILAGGAGGRLRPGRHVQYPAGTPIANLWLTMARIMGLSRERIGDSTGSLEEIVG